MIKHIILFISRLAKTKIACCQFVAYTVYNIWNANILEKSLHLKQKIEIN